MSIIHETNDRVFCFHGPLLYEARIKDSRLTDGNQEYKVHYHGWKDTWDEWVPEDRVKARNEENAALKTKLEQDATLDKKEGGKEKAKGANASTAKGATTKNVQRGTKRGHEDDSNNSRAPAMKLTVPEPLKAQLVDDWESVTKELSVVKIPRKPNVQTILEDFEKYAVENKPESLREPELLTHTVVNGIQVYFDRCLGSQLLYKFERIQYSEVRHNYITGQHVDSAAIPEMSGLYGAEHLLRLLVTLPQLVAQAGLDHESTMLLQDYVKELLLWMSEHRKELFLEEYEQRSAQYQNVSRA
ncbi:MRG-domain-containing protein [Cylindrobasidium torrendii FP15055 ss-10]|uniref:Chromatin modification-related protein EAF3 n=1 Tax=Cylindrobasidium torrendii FP15055 ss-10 TaxID=1314674 RepID=A0A0D7BBN3_9AGAR|nr:MRG-domain-containing protein [Cylindrobasidium torrendii FP15055 ss-10]